MQIKYSKSANDINVEMEKMIDDSQKLFAQRSGIPNQLEECENRINCILCSSKLSQNSKEFLHRDILFLICSVCGHIQTKTLPPLGYPYTDNDVSFANIYPELTSQEYESRVNRIYKPKLDWVLDSLKSLGMDKQKLNSNKWLEIGCGAGYFLKALRNYGFKSCFGFEKDEKLVEISNHANGKTVAQRYEGTLAEAIKRKSDIYVAFFVLEHSEDMHNFLNELKKKPKGTIFVFSVPVFGISCLLEGVFKKEFARNLDGIIHTQLYTDKSIEYAMDIAGYEITHEWVFGQDAMDVTRFFSNSLKKNYSKVISNDIQRKLLSMQNSLQNCLDQFKLSDQRHVIAVKKY